jgi:hypothetical protein
MSSTDQPKDSTQAQNPSASSSEQQDIGREPFKFVIYDISTGKLFLRWQAWVLRE